jgi:hypothetical protein
MNAPTNLNHKPIISVNDYDAIDGKYASNTDAQALCIGNAQYSRDEISAKVFRKVKGRWSRQSEELPIHRVLDLAVLIVASMTSAKKPAPSKSNLNEVTVKPGELHTLETYYKTHRVYLEPRLKELKKQLDLLL